MPSLQNSPWGQSFASKETWGFVSRVNHGPVRIFATMVWDRMYHAVGTGAFTPGPIMMRGRYDAISAAIPSLPAAQRLHQNWRGGKAERTTHRTTLTLLCPPSFVRRGCWLITLLIDSKNAGHARYLYGSDMVNGTPNGQHNGSGMSVNVHLPVACNHYQPRHKHHYKS